MRFLEHDCSDNQIYWFVWFDEMFIGFLLFSLGILVIGMWESKRGNNRLYVAALALGWLIRCYNFYGNYWRYDLDTTIMDPRLALSYLYKQYAIIGSLLILLIGGKIFP